MWCFISFFLVFFHFLQTMHKKSALILIADTTPYKKIIKIISTFFVIFFSYYQDFFCASFVIFSLIILNLLIFCLCFKYFYLACFLLNRSSYILAFIDAGFPSPTCFKYFYLACFLLNRNSYILAFIDAGFPSTACERLLIFYSKFKNVFFTKF